MKPNSLSAANIPLQVRARAARAGLTLTALAERAGMLQPQLARVLGTSHRKIHLATVLAIANALGCGVDDMLAPIAGRNKARTR